MTICTMSNSLPNLYLQHYAPHVPFYYTTITMGIDPGYTNQVFYNKILDNDTQRVVDRFRNAENDQVMFNNLSFKILVGSG